MSDSDSDSDSTTGAFDRSIQSGMEIGGYKIISKLGEGGFGVVYLAERGEPVRRRVALKVIKPGMDSLQIVARFEAERQALAVMDHTNVAKVFDAGMTDTGRSYFVMEYVKGIPITEHCDRQRLGIEDRLKLFTEVCDAVQHAHQKGIIHRDLKPRNILVAFEGNRSICKVIDFGVAKAISGPLTDRTLYTEQGQIIGTPEYMSPEQAEMTSQDIDTRSDIYSLGVVLYELLAGSLPFSSEYLRTGGIDHVRSVIRDEEPPTPSTRITSLDADSAIEITKSRHIELSDLKRELKGDLDWIILKAMDKDRQRRYETANGLAMDIQRYLGNEPVVARPPSSLYRLSKTIRRNRGAFFATVTVAIALVLGFAIAMWGFATANYHRGVAETRLVRAENAEREAQADRDVARQAQASADQQRELADQLAERRGEELYTAQINLAHEAWLDGDLDLARQLLVSQLPGPGERDLRGFEWRYLWQLFRDESQDTLLTFKTWKESFRRCFSRDGSKLAVAQDKTIRVWDLATATESARLNLNGPPATTLAFSSDADLLAVGDGERILLWDMTAEAAPRVFASETPVALAFGPAKKRLCSATKREHGRVEMWNLETGEQIWSRRGHFDRDKKEHTLCMAFTFDGTKLVTGGGDTRAKLWDAETGESIGQPLTEHSAWVLSAVFSPDGKRLATAGIDSRVLLWDVDTLQAGPALLGHKGPVESVAFSPNGETLVSVGDDSTVRCWDVATSRPISILRGHTARVASVAYSADGQSLVSISRKSVKVWDAPPHMPENVLDDHEGWLDGVVVSPSGKTLAVTDYHAHAVKVRDVASRALTELPLPEGGHHDLAFSPNEKWLASGSDEGMVRLWDMNSRQEYHKYSWDNDINSVTFSYDSKVFAAARRDGGVKFWDVASKRQIELIRDSADTVEAVAFSPRDGTLAACYLDGSVSVWGNAYTQEVASFDVDPDVNSVRFSRDGNLLAVGGRFSSRIIVFDISQDKVVARLPEGCVDMAFAPDSKSLAITRWDSTVKIWNIAAGQVALTLRHIGPATGVSFPRDGLLMATSGADGTIRLWPAASMTEVDARLSGGEGRDDLWSANSNP